MSADTTPSTGTTKRRPAAERKLPDPPPQAVMGLLNYITATSLDEDYAAASSSRQTDGQKTTRPGWSALAMIAVFGILVATAAVQTSRAADTTATSHDELVKQINARKGQLADRRERVDDLTSETETLETKFLEATTEGRAVQSRLTSLGAATGADAARGPGVRVRVDDGPPIPSGQNEILDGDLQKLVNGLWLSGAEGIALNGERLTSLSAIRQGGAVITVNYRPISPPYTLSVIGDPDTLAARFIDTPGGQWWLDLQALYGVDFEITNTEEPLTLPPARRSGLRYAHTPETLR
jgi:uncharacterized protein YlxW (UPF0749 family)